MAAWSLTDAERLDVVERLTASISTLAFSRNERVADDIAKALAVGIERKAYTAAEVASNTTTGTRPKHETTAAYARKLSSLLIESLRDRTSVASGNGEDGIAVSMEGASLVLGGEREFYDEAAAKAALAPLLAADSRITRVKFSTKSFGRAAAEVARRAISNAKDSLTDADLSDVIAGRPEDEAKESLRIMAEGLSECKLRALDLSDNALGEKGIVACKAALQHMTTLESLTLQNVGLSVHACRALADLLPNPEGLKKLHLANNMSDDEGAKSIGQLLAKAPNMQDFKMWYCRVKGPGGSALAHGLSASTHLISIDLGGNPMGPGVAGDLAAALTQQQNQRVLRLGDTLLENEGVSLICTALSHTAPYLEELDLSLNELTAEGAVAVARCIMGKPGITKLNLRENELGDRGVVTVCRALSANTALRVLDLSENQIKGPGAIAAAKACCGRKGLEMLALDGNWIPEDTVEEVRALFAGGAAGEGALGPMEDNDPDMADEEEEEEADGLADQMGGVRV